MNLTIIDDFWRAPTGYGQNGRHKHICVNDSVYHLVAFSCFAFCPVESNFGINLFHRYIGKRTSQSLFAQAIKCTPSSNSLLRYRRLVNLCTMKEAA